MKREPSVMQTFRTPEDVDNAISIVMKRKTWTKKQLMISSLFDANEELFKAILGLERYNAIASSVIRGEEEGEE